jgi:tetratricopeptide (TPR) repeat protein
VPRMLRTGPPLRRDALLIRGPWRKVWVPALRSSARALHRVRDTEMGLSMRSIFLAMMLGAVIAGAVSPIFSVRAIAAANEPADQPVDPAPCVAAAAANDDDKIVAICGPLIDNEKTLKPDRVKALIARAGAYDRNDQIDRAIGDYDTALQLDPALADIFNARGELWRRKGDRRRALADFGAVLKLNPDHPVARGNYKSLALELERLGAMMAVNNKPSFDCAIARRPVEKAICGNPELANLDREINAANIRVVREATAGSPRGGRAMQREQDDFLARRDAGFGRPDFDLQKMLRERLDHLLAAVRN